MQGAVVNKAPSSQTQQWRYWTSTLKKGEKNAKKP